MNENAIPSSVTTNVFIKIVNSVVVAVVVVPEAVAALHATRAQRTRSDLSGHAEAEIA